MITNIVMPTKPADASQPVYTPVTSSEINTVSERLCYHQRLTVFEVLFLGLCLAVAWWLYQQPPVRPVAWVFLLLPAVIGGLILVDIREIIRLKRQLKT